MTLAAGTLLGPYEILSPLGAGGMGEVYRARDPRLNRDVAVKVLPEEFFEGEEKSARFEREARLLAALNHPGIAAIYSFEEIPGSSSSSSSSTRHVLVMELVEGQTLRKLLAGEVLPLKRLLSYATQMAEGLAKAHATGIVHRDLKPENVMVTREGGVKILDFGLAKLVEDPALQGELTQSPTASVPTGAGVVLGTVPYMSPEQALGKPLDFRSDQFSFGSILYEMASGRRAFLHSSAPETMAAIIREETAPLASTAPDLPLPLRWIVERCLAKDPEDRYASTKDLARDLARLRDGASDLLTSSGTRAAASARPGAPRALLIAAAALATGAVLAVIATRKPPAGPPVWRPLTFRRGSIGGARFGPDGKTVVYAAAWQGRPVQLFTTRLDSTESTALPLPSANLAAVSGKGMLAIVLPRNLAPVVAEVSLAGGAPRELVEGGRPGSLTLAVSPADWSPNGDGLAVSRDGQLEFPIGKVLVPRTAEASVRSPRFSPDGRRIAFIQSKEGREAIGVTDLNGKKTILSEGWEIVTSLAWHPRTGEIWYSARAQNTRFGVVELNAVSLSGVRRVVARTPTLMIIEDIAPDGGVLLRSDDWPTTMTCLPPGASREVDLTWLDFSIGVDLSDDGQDLLFTEGGAAEGSKSAVYMRKTDGSSPAVRLGDGLAQKLSPDRKWVVQVTPERIKLLPTGAGESLTIMDEGLEYRGAWMFPDGKRLLVQARPGGKFSRLYVRDLAAGPPRPFTPDGFGCDALSPDGTIVVGGDKEGNVVLIPVDGGAPRPLPGLGPLDFIMNFDTAGKSLFVTRSGLPLRIDRYDIASGSRSLWKEIALADPTGVEDMSNAQLTPDGACYCYSFMRGLSRLYYVEGLR